MFSFPYFLAVRPLFRLLKVIVSSNGSLVLGKPELVPQEVPHRRLEQFCTKIFGVLHTLPHDVGAVHELLPYQLDGPSLSEWRPGDSLSGALPLTRAQGRKSELAITYVFS